MPEVGAFSLNGLPTICSVTLQNPYQAMYLLSGAAGGACILASVFLVAELIGLYEAPLTGGVGSRSLAYGRIALFGIVAVASAAASMRLHRRSNLDPTRRPSPRLILVEGILFTLVGGVLFAGSFLYLQMSGGFMGLHLIGFLLGGGLLLQGVRRLGTRL